MLPALPDATLGQGFHCTDESAIAATDHLSGLLTLVPAAFANLHMK